MSDKTFELKNFKEYLSLKIDISDKDYLVYNPKLAPTDVKKNIEPSLSEEQLYRHMKEISEWSFFKDGDDEFYKKDCIDFLRDTDFQSFSQYGKLINRNYFEAKTAYLFDSYLRNFLQEILERIEIFLKKSTSDAVTIGYCKTLYLFEDEDIYYNESKKYNKNNLNRRDLVLKTRYHISRLILEKQDDKLIQKQIDKYGVVLPWTVFRLMTFGNISSFLISLQPDYRNKVAKYVSLPLSECDKISARFLLSWCNALRYLRNICSHNGRLYKRLHNMTPKIHRSNVELLNIDVVDREKTLFSYFVAMRHIMLAMSRESQLFWNSKLEKLSEESAHYQINLVHYGFPTDWCDSLKIDIDSC